jgi:isopenicillin-N epimerase
MVIRSLHRHGKLGPGDEVLATDHEYGAMERAWRYVAGAGGFHFVRRPMPVPFTTRTAWVDHFWAGVTRRTRAVFLSHVTSATGLIFPVAEVCALARAAGLLCLVDGAHGPGQLPLRLAELGADVYVGACHKWLCAPPGSAFLYARPEVQRWLDPLVVSWGWEAEQPSGVPFVDYHEWQGTRDFAAFLAVPAAIRFQAEHDWPQVQARCRALVRDTRARLNALTGQPPLCPPTDDWLGQMAAVALPPGTGPAALQARLWAEHRIEVPCHFWNGLPVLRFSVQGYNTQADVDALVGALRALL